MGTEATVLPLPSLKLNTWHQAPADRLDWNELPVGRDATISPWIAHCWPDLDSGEEEMD